MTPAFKTSMCKPGKSHDKNFSAASLTAASEDKSNGIREQKCALMMQTSVTCPLTTLWMRLLGVCFSRRYRGVLMSRSSKKM